MIFVKDNQCRYVLANDAMARFFNTTKEQVLGKTDQELAENTRVYPCKSSDQRILDQAETFTIEERLGNRIYEVTKFPLELRDNKRGIGGIMRDVTERKRDENAIQNERQLLRTLIDNLPFSIYVKDMECRKVVANITDVEKMGYTSEAEVLGKTDLELFEGGDGIPSYNDDLLVVKEGRSIINREEHFSNPGGGLRWTVTTKVPLFDQSGKIVGMVGIGRDITEQKKAHETILKLSKSIEQSPSSIIITDARGIIEYANPRFIEVTGYSPDEVIGQMHRMLKPGKIDTKQLEEIWRTINSGETWRGEIDNRKKNKTKYLEWVVVSPVLDEHKRITNILIICEDITSQKREEKLKEVIQSITHDGSVAKDLIDFTSNVKKRLENLIDLTNFYLALYDESKDMFWIPAYYDQHDEIEIFPAGKTITAYVLRSKKSLLANYDEMCKLKDSGVIESLGVPAQVWMGVPLLVGEKAIGVLAVQSYDNPLLYNEQDKLLLERVAHEISYIIQRIKSDEEVKQALEKAEESDRLKSAFLANMSHEIRTPLNSVIGFSELLADPTFEAEQKDEFVQHIIQNGNYLLNIISDIVDLSKIEAGEITIRKKPTTVCDLIEEVKRVFSYKIESKSLKFVVNTPPCNEKILVLCDRERVMQIFANLLNNALKFTTEGYIELGCRVLETNVEFYVKDTGIGIPEKYHHKVFDRFTQVETSYSRRVGGNGLGLSISKNLIELMDGRIWLESQASKGSTFYFTLNKC
jgi:PAS domain S-box-containing protein